MLTFRSLVYINEIENKEIFWKAANAIVGTVIIFFWQYSCLTYGKENKQASRQAPKQKFGS